MSKSKSSDLRIGVTTGDPAGIGPDICLTSYVEAKDLAEVVYFADPAMLEARAAILNLRISINSLDRGQYANDALNVIPVDLPSTVTIGQSNPLNAPYVIGTLDQALKACTRGDIAAIVTAPVNKANIIEGGFSFSGHTEWFAEQTGTPRVVMMLLAGGLRVALATTHLPLSAVPAAITTELLEETIEILIHDLTHKFGVAKPNVMICGLNPHAGEGGHLGREEIEVITPLIEKLQRKGHHLTGPVPADTAFTTRALEHADAVLAMYHDQGLPVLKHAAFGHAVNVTLGLPVIRTSVDHGTAYDIAGTGQADAASFVEAIRCAVQLASDKT